MVTAGARPSVAAALASLEETLDWLDGEATRLRDESTRLQAEAEHAVAEATDARAAIELLRRRNGHAQVAVPAEPDDEPDEVLASVRGARSRRQVDLGRRPAAPPVEIAGREREDAIVRILVYAGESLARGAIWERAPMSKHHFKAAIEQLVETGKLQRVGRGAGTRYDLTERLDAEVARLGTVGVGFRAGQQIGHHYKALRRKVYELVKANRGTLTEQMLAARLGEHREHVAMVCGELLEDDSFRMNPDGTYSIAGRSDGDD